MSWEKWDYYKANIYTEFPSEPTVSGYPSS